MRAVSNSTPIIYLAQVNKLDLLKRIYGEVYVCSAFWRDFIYPILHAKPIPEDIPIILKAREKGGLKLKDPETDEAIKLRNEMIAQGMGSGESNSMALAKELKAIFLANDKLAIETAKQYRVEARWFTVILHDALKAGFIKILNNTPLSWTLAETRDYPSAKGKEKEPSKQPRK